MLPKSFPVILGETILQRDESTNAVLIKLNSSQRECPVLY
jgi:hypothetical protein